MYAIKEKEEAKIKKVLKDGRDDYMAVKLATGETRVVHRNLGESLVKKGAAKEVKEAIDEANRVRAAKRRQAEEGKKQA